MLTAYNCDTSRVLTGSSTNNECVERLWRDVHRSVTDKCAKTFNHLENEKVLDPVVDLYCLHCLHAMNV